ncbi:alpha subunit of pyruvate dehydrogenase [Borealophlyctis nickersoniae]|nr:alpha subunit of pyruvate dehydrogenase [Borealophlyctis nickersoniae]
MMLSALSRSLRTSRYPTQASSVRRLIRPTLSSSQSSSRAFFAAAARTFATEASSDDVYTFEFPETHFAMHNCEPVPLKTTATKDELIDLYKMMVSIRHLETACDQLYKSKMIRGFCHLSTGQEAVAAGMEAAITKEDAIITAYRCHGFALTRGQSATAIIAELMGRKAGSSKGKGGSMHIFANEFYGGNGIVGAQVPLGAGIALAQQYQGKNAMTFSLYGDGASNQGQVFEAYNMAKLWNLPCVFVCENNMYGMGTSAHRSSASTKYYTRGDYIPGIRVNGRDALAVREGCRYAREWALSGKGPLVMEMVTYRYGGHSMSDPGTTYRTRDEIAHMRSTSDPITGHKERLLEHGLLTNEEMKKIEKEIRADIEKAVAEAKASPEPDVAELYTEVYCKGTEPPFLRGTTPDEIHRF